MPEISLTSGGDGGNDGGGSSGGGGLDINSMLDQLEDAQKKLMENPQLAKMLGVDMEAFETHMTEANQAAEGAGVELDHEFLENLLSGMVSMGFEDTTLGELKTYVENNPDEVDNLIGQYT